MKKPYILVTGASRGIGRSIALKYAQEGYHVFLNCRNSIDKLKEVETEITRKLDGSCTLVPGDVGSAADVARIFDQIHQITPSLDILINNAGISQVGLFIDMTDEEWDKIISTNLSSAVYCSRAALKDMTRFQSGRIVNISSMWGTVGASCEVAYSTTKSGINGLTKALAKEYAPSGIQVNAIACGVIDTEMNHNLSTEERDALAEEIPFGRFASSEEVADLVWNLTRTPHYMTGQIIGIDGGYI